MSAYSLLIFVHVVSAITLAASSFFSLLTLVALRRAVRVEQVRPILDLVALAEPVAALSLILTPTAGILMVVTVWGWQNGWINVALASLVVLLLPAGAVTGLRRRTITQLIDNVPDGALPKTIEARIHDPLLGTSAYLMVTLVLGIVFLMTTKPLLAGSLVTMGVAVLLGVVASLPLWFHQTGVS